jgi:Zn-dependent peptidase ImmA (M78 family)
MENKLANEIREKIIEFRNNIILENNNQKELTLNFAQDVSEWAEQCLHTIGKNLQLPINIFAIAKALDLEVLRIDLSDGTKVKRDHIFTKQTSLSKINSQMISFNGNTIIGLDKNKPIENSKFALANQIGFYLLSHNINTNDKNLMELRQFSEQPFFNIETDEFYDKYVAKIFAMCLLLPLRLFLEKFDIYATLMIKNNQININQWLKYLSDSVAIDDYNFHVTYEFMIDITYSLYRKEPNNFIKDYPNLCDISKIRDVAS